MPFWGRPPGARQGRKTSKGWSKRRWEERRVEELSDSDDEAGVELDLGGSRFTSDELHFTGFDLGSGIRRRHGRNESEDDESEDSDGDSENDMVVGAQNMQIMLREKEDYLVERALERIRRAQIMGKTNVKLSQQEMEALDALDRKNMIASGPQRPRGKKGTASRPQEEGKRKKRKSKERYDKESPRLAATEPRKSGRSSLGSRGDTQLAYSVDPYGPAGGLGQVYYAPPAIRPSSSSSRSGSRNPSNQSLRQSNQAPTMPAYPLPYPQGRYYSIPEVQGSRVRRPSSSSSRASSRPDPADPSWEPRARSSSTLPYPLDPPQYPPYPVQTLPSYFDPRDARFAGRRVASGPPDIYPSGPIPSNYYRYPPNEMVMHSGSDPNLAGLSRGRRPSSSSSESSSTDEDEDEGVQVEVIDRPSGYGVQTRSNASSSKAKGGGTTSKRGKGKR